MNNVTYWSKSKKAIRFFKDIMYALFVNHLYLVSYTFCLSHRDRLFSGIIFDQISLRLLVACSSLQTRLYLQLPPSDWTFLDRFSIPLAFEVNLLSLASGVGTLTMAFLTSLAFPSSFYAMKFADWRLLNLWNLKSTTCIWLSATDDYESDE